jgi:L-2,4-diaminobutyrate transaminase
VGAATALAVLKALDDEDIVGHVANLGPYLHKTMREAVGDNPLVGEIRGRGFMLGVELVKDRATKEAFSMEERVGRRLLKGLLDRGLVSRALGDTLVFAPPLVITGAEIDELVGKFSDGLDALTRELKR